MRRFSERFGSLMTESGRGPPTSSVVSEAAENAAFEQIDWDRTGGSERRLSAERVALLAGFLLVGLAYVYFRTQRRTYLFMRWNIGNEDWLLMIAAAILVAYGIVPLARNRSAVRRSLRRLGGRIPTVLSLCFLMGLLALSLWATVKGFEPSLWSPDEGPVDGFQRPVGFGDSASWDHPLGTDRWGYDLVDLLIAGARPFAYLSVVTLGLIVPLATAVGMAAGYYGGRIDDLLMSYVDVQLSVPAILIYMVAYMFVFNSMAMLLVAFGLLSWGGIARIVRSETLQRSEDGYVLSAQAIGARDRYILKRHLLPNVTNTVIPATAHLIAILVLTEAGLAFIGFHASFQSWGMTISEGIFYGSTRAWWNSAFPAIAVTLTVLALKISGDGLRDVLDPRGGS